uniref:WD repeat-containing protein on Y chromosome isoform X2 n=1 Tax=Ciona intestinalis TaxID=7719 RepID=UPI000EF4F64B|nr:WD repeat-containing protein on Y chromosome isoform X2 [Ciona intestinalis]|eukprot:XP_026689544.1 WD repeat-containing protein on Y chromosome isoform X2 [Ciona intestinalis]
MSVDNDAWLRKNRDLESSLSTYSKEGSSIRSDEHSNSDSSIRLEEHIKLHHLQKLLQVFKTHTPTIDENSAHEKSQLERHAEANEETGQVKQGPGMMSLQEFKATISSMLGTSRWNEQMEMLFYKVDTACDGYVDWNEFCTYMLLQMREWEHIQNLKLIPFESQAVVGQIFNNKQETTTRTLVVENPTRIVSISKVGTICVWDFELKLLKTFSLAADAVEDNQTSSRRRFHTWVTDAIYMRNTQNIALTTSSREIYFYDISTSNYTIEFCLYAIPNVPVCAYYWYNKNARNGHCKLFFGDDTGCAHILHFYAPQSRLFQKPFSPQQGTQRVYFNDLKDHRQFVSYESIGSIHNDVMRRILYVPQSDVIISSSMSSSTSVVLMDVKRKNRPYIFKVNKGAECFDYSKSLNILATGSLDHLVRIWNPYVVARPIVILQGHSTGICDVVINEAYGQIVTYSKDAIIKVWDIKEQTCLQTISPKFPSLQLDRIPDHGEVPLSLYGSPHNIMILTCNDSIALLKMGKLEPKAELPVTHEAALCGAAYNPLFHQIVTASDDSTVSVWDIETGSKSLTFSNAHGQEEITCLSFDDTCRRLFTGARDGTIKVWSFQNGNCLHELEPLEEAEVTGVLSFQDRTILAVGWNRRIVIYDDSDPDTVNIKPTTSWKAGQLHQDDILAVAHCPPNLLVTASYDGCIIVWNEETQQIYLTLREGKSQRGGQPSRPVDTLLCLPERMCHLQKKRTILISSESGYLYWWCLFGRNALLGYFRATEHVDASILSMCSAVNDKFLVTVDTVGELTVWDVRNYCIGDSESEPETIFPPILYKWKAHDSAIVSVDFIEHEFNKMLVTASTDKTARLWTLEGRFIGTFGQKKKWNLKRPATYQYPLNPWGERILIPEPSYQQHCADEEEQTSDGNKLADSGRLNGDGSTDDELSSINEKGDNENNVKTEDETWFHNDDVDQSAYVTVPTSVTQDENSDLTKHFGKNRHNSRRMTTHPMEDPNEKHLPKLRERYIESRSITFANFHTNKKEQILGLRAEQLLNKRSVTRQQRRYRVGYIDKDTTARFGNLCSPFQALAIRETESVSFKEEMPMTQRMVEKGLRCNNEDDLHKMPLNHLYEYHDSDGLNAQQGKRRSNQVPHRRNHTLPPLHSPAAEITSSVP